jgi:hypothetical protein
MVSLRYLFTRLACRFFFPLVRLILWASSAARQNGRIRRSLWTGTPIITMPINARAERLLGVQADSLVYHTYFITDQFTYNLSRWMRIPGLRLMIAFFVFTWAAIRYQRFHFYLDAGLLPSSSRLQINREEVKILFQLGKEIFFWTYGADVRTRKKTEALGAFHCCLDCPAPSRACICDDTQGEKNVALLAQHSKAVFAMGDMLEYTPGSRNDLFFWPVDLDAGSRRKYAPYYPDSHGTGPIHIVHAPNHRAFKGTRFLLDAVEKLRAEGFPITLTIVERIPNDRALEIYRTADIIFDQCMVGFHGYLTLEAMAMGKPVMCFIRKPQQYLLHPEECPIVNTPADQIETTLRNLLSNRNGLHELGVQGRKYVEKFFTPEAFAQRLRSAYRQLGVDSV